METKIYIKKLIKLHITDDLTDFKDTCCQRHMLSKTWPCESFPMNFNRRLLIVKKLLTTKVEKTTFFCYKKQKCSVLNYICATFHTKRSIPPSCWGTHDFYATWNGMKFTLRGNHAPLSKKRGGMRVASHGSLALLSKRQEKLMLLYVTVMHLQAGRKVKSPALKQKRR